LKQLNGAQEHRERAIKECEDFNNTSRGDFTELFGNLIEGIFEVTLYPPFLDNSKNHKFH
jgi:hypothetical protein